ncbi:hypothetical protein OXV62_12175 [Bacteroides faecis]|nr:hypothetical protein [Bacteroides faecis]
MNPNNSGQFSDGSYTLETYKAFTNSCYTALINNIYQSSDYLVCTEAGTDIWEEPKSGSSYQRYHSYNGMKPMIAIIIKCGNILICALIAVIL